ncbi:MAG: menaquinone biosynthesis protein [Chthoniobacterales bacterium]
MATRLGCVKYLNARPLIDGWEGPVEFDHPAALCRKLAAGALDVALVSSFELLRHPIYFVVDGLAIASDGPVHSVILAHDLPPNELREVVSDPASATSINLLRVLFPDLQIVPEGKIGGTRGALFIGDQAIAFRRGAGESHQILDLGTEWKRRTGLPFVYALWLIHPDYAEKTAIAEALRDRAAQNLDRLDALIAAEPPAEREFAEFYFRDCLRFSFGAAEKKGLQTFAELCAKPIELKLV